MDAKEWLEGGKKRFYDMIGKGKGEKPSLPKNGEGVSLGDEIVRSGMMSGDEVSENLARQFGIPVRKEIAEISVTREILKKVPYAFAKKHVILPIEKRGEEIVVAISDPLNLDPLEELRMILGAPIAGIYVPRDVILSAINDCYNKEEGAASQLLTEMGEGGESDLSDDVEIYDLLDDNREQSPIIKLLNLILTEAIGQNASDIHFEPLENALRVRYRIDGVLQNRHTPSTEFSSQLLARIKVMAKLDIAERRLPQDGRIKLRMGRREIDFRVSTVPIVDGERIVLRILDKGNLTLGLRQLGMSPSTIHDFERLIKLPEGIILVTGPTGSGKTTTLYSAVSDLYSDQINIMTIEDPVEYNLKGIAQIGVKPKIDLTFAAGLRTILRQDPDVVMVGEIRDRETADIAIQASLTGHLVVSTLHTNDAPSAVTRLVDMGIEPYLISSSLIAVLAQRLVRRICPRCKVSYQPSIEELKSIGLPLDTGELFRGKGCERCFGTGYIGRHGVYELMVVDSVIQQQIVKSADAVALRRIASEQGMKTLRNDGARLALQGVTTISEVLRVVKEGD